MTSKESNSSVKKLVLGSLFIGLLSIAIKGIDSFYRLYPWLLLYTPFREEQLRAWQKFAPIDHSIVYPIRHIPEIYAKGNLIYFKLNGI